jgi:hypothetical protein
MPLGSKRIPPALKHGAYSEVTLLPGEDPDEFAELHRGLIAEFAPNGRMEEETVATIARLTWRRQNLARFQIGQLSNYMIEAIREGTKKLDEGGLSNVVSDLNKMVEARERVEKAQGNRKTEALVEFGEIAKQATLSVDEATRYRGTFGFNDRQIDKATAVREGTQINDVIGGDGCPSYWSKGLPPDSGGLNRIARFVRGQANAQRGVGCSLHHLPDLRYGGARQHLAAV